MRLTTTWRRVGTATADLVMDLGVVDEGNHVVAVCQHALGYGARRRSRDWIEGVPMRESYALVLDRGLPTGRYRVLVRLGLARGESAGGSGALAGWQDDGSAARAGQVQDQSRPPRVVIPQCQSPDATNAAQ